ncbi:MjaI restriction endonuclease [Sedimentisphaera cyanobacteriorum]|uniref:MjaI restriction endonuclease n=1 Tax=Sedimentisphaera cyanobacteriorum TaxID=1940790 RepID=A0A1Q2HQC9_9BACT|nr:MjaI restriction endonuclease [Sedimentisphaera cyanobacteriorum]
MVIDRTYDGYVTEINTVYGQLEQKIGCKIEPAPDKWDRLYNVDFYIKVKDNYLGIQIKPVSEGIQLSQIFKERGLQAHSHCQFREVFGGKVFYVFSSKVNGKKMIRNHEVVEEIKEEIRRIENA